MTGVVDSLLAPAIGGLDARRTPAGDARRAESAPESFGEVLARRAGWDRIQFSGHALQRIERRGIDVAPQTLARLQEGVERAAGKGARQSVVLVDGTAFVVSVRNRTVITAVDAAHMRDHVFTNIDSAVIA